MKPWRANLVLIILFGLGAIIIGRLIFLQIIDQGFYKAFAQGQQNINSFAKGERGSIFLQDKNGSLYILASNLRVPYVFVSPAEVKDPEQTSQSLAEILQIEKEEIALALQNQNSLHEVLKKRISEAEEQKIQDLKLPGVHVAQEQVRSYPQGELASHVAGFTNQDGEGQYGVEEYAHEVLDGKEGIRSGSRNPASYLLSAFHTATKNGDDVVLTIDYNIQSLAESLLEKAESSLGLEGATIIVMDPASGKILALAARPTFDPNAYSKVQDIKVFQNPAIQTTFEPGSIFKPITMASALDANAVTPETTYIDEGVVKIGGRKIYNYDLRTWGKRTMTEVLEYSINTGVVFAEHKLGHEKFLEYIEQFGIFEPTGIELASEIFSRNTQFKKGYEINFSTAAFGQGIEMTPLQIIKAFTAIANNGTLVDPYIVEGTKSEKISERSPIGRQILNPHTASQLTSMLTSVVQNGFAKTAQIPGYHVAGKTGTAEVSWSALGVAKSGYSDKTIQSFIGYAPAFNPKFLVLVKLDNPATKTAEYSAVPIFRDLAKYMIDYYQIPPDLTVE